MIDVAQHRHDRWPQHQLIGILSGQDALAKRAGSLLDIFDDFQLRQGLALDGDAELLTHDGCGAEVDRFGDRHHHPVVHQGLDDVDGAAMHLLGQLSHRDVFWNDDFGDCGLCALSWAARLSGL